MVDVPDIIKRLRERHDTLSDEAADALQGLIDIPEDMEIISGWLVQRNVHEPEYPVEGYGSLPYSDADPLLNLSQIPGWNPAPEGLTVEYRCTGPDGETPRPLFTEGEARRHAQMGCGEIQERQATPWQKASLSDE